MVYHTLVCSNKSGKFKLETKVSADKHKGPCMTNTHIEYQFVIIQWQMFVPFTDMAWPKFRVIENTHLLSHFNISDRESGNPVR